MDDSGKLPGIEGAAILSGRVFLGKRKASGSAWLPDGKNNNLFSTLLRGNGSVPYVAYEN